MVLSYAENGSLHLLKQLICKDPDLVHVRDSDNYTPLHRACYNNHVEVIKLLIEYGADTRAKTHENWEPLHCACKWSHVEAASLMLHNGAYINALTNGNVTPLHLASATKNRNLIELLLYHPDINLDIKNNSGDTALDIARRYNPYYKLFEYI
jgi:hypothetical protein